MTSKDIVFVLSGGNSANDPKNSLGGPPSSVEITSEINNLFPDITQQQIQQGLQDVRCFYITNKNKGESLTNITIWLEKNQNAGTEVQLGLALQNEVQLLSVVDAPTMTQIPRGHIFFISPQHNNGKELFQRTKTILWDTNLDVMANKMESALNSLIMLEGITIDPQPDGNFFINFTGFTGNHKRPLLVSKSNFNSEITELVSGSPINTIAPNIGVPNNLPTGVIFKETPRGQAIALGTLEPGDFVPVWIKRAIDSNSTPVHPDKFTIHLEGSVVPFINNRRGQSPI